MHFGQDRLGPRHENLWFDDGSIVLAAHCMSFKVHQSVLGLHSSVFFELLDNLEPWEQRLDDGCPIVRVDDYGPDLAKLLLVLYGLDRCANCQQKWMS